MDVVVEGDALNVISALHSKRIFEIVFLFFFTMTLDA